MKLGDAEKRQINALKQVANIWHCLMLGIVCFGKTTTTPRTGVPHLPLPYTPPSLDHLAIGVPLPAIPSLDQWTIWP